MIHPPNPSALVTNSNSNATTPGFLGWGLILEVESQEEQNVVLPVVPYTFPFTHFYFDPASSEAMIRKKGMDSPGEGLI